MSEDDSIVGKLQEFLKLWKNSCGVMVNMLVSYVNDPGFDPKECLVGFGCFFTVLAI